MLVIGIVIGIYIGIGIMCIFQINKDSRGENNE